MVENSLGRLWLEGHPDEELKSKWKYYLEEAEQEPEVQKQLEEIRAKSKDIRPEDIKVLDPAMGSGHILVYAFNVLYDIYKSAGYSERDIPRLILENNLYGLDIDDRAAQLAYFAVMMKARSKSRRIFREKVNVNLCAIQESNGFPKEAIDYLVNQNVTEIEKQKLREDVEYLINVFHDAKEYGSILEVKPIDFDAIERRLEEIRNGGTQDLFEYQYRNIILEKIPALVKQTRIMSQKYDVVCTNPPYMGNGGMNLILSEYLKQHYPNTKGDMSTVFMEKSLGFSNNRGYMAMINIPTWMFLSTYEMFREKIINNYLLISVLHFGRGIFGSDFGTTSFVIANRKCKKYLGTYRKLYTRQGLVDSIEQKEKWFFSNFGKYLCRQDYFTRIPKCPIAYWINEKILNAFNNKTKLLGNMIELVEGIHSRNNEYFLKFWHEVDITKSSIYIFDKSKKWFPINKGGNYRKWYGNNYYVVNWENDGYEIRNYKKASIGKCNNYFNDGITYTSVTISVNSFRYFKKGFLYDVSGPSIYINNKNLELQLLALLNSKVGQFFINMFNPTIALQIGDIKRIPFLYVETLNDKEYIDSIVKVCICISENDWDSFETSWDFKKHPLFTYKGNCTTIEQAFNNWATFAEKQFKQLKANEEELNRIFIEIYGLQDELTPEVEDKDVTIRKADRERDIKSFISYAVGCMFGRYSIDAEGLIYAGGDFKDKWKCENGQWKVRKIVKDEEGKVVEDTWVNAAFAPDMDNVLPITDDEYFEDDIVSRFIEFLKVTFGEDTLEENLDYIADTLGRKSSETARQAIRRYFLKDFYKDHVQVYQKKPIYWLFDSGKQDGFKALIYMHRYDEFTVARVRTDYLHKLQKSYEAEIKRLDIIIDSNVSQREKTNARKKKEQILKQMEECLQYDQVIAHVANQRIKIDLDDGVSVNYSKFQGIEVPQGEGRKPLKADLLAKI
jgi:hypothetical protein